MERPQLVQEIIAAIGPNADNRITGTVLRNILIKVVDGTQLNLVGMAYTDTEPVTDIEDLTYAPIYIAAGTGTYTHFDAIELDNELALLKYTEDGWIKQTVIVLSEIDFPQVQALIDLAEKWAEEAEDTEVETGKFSAKHWAMKSLEYAQDGNLVALGQSLTELLAVYSSLGALLAVHADLANIDTVADDIAKVNTLAANIAALQALNTNLNALLEVHTNLAAILAAEGYATNAEDSATLASKWAEEAEDVEVETGKYSAKHHAAKAADSETNIVAAKNYIEANIDAINAAPPAAIAAATSEANAQKWAQNPEDVEVETGKYSAKHYALKAEQTVYGYQWYGVEIDTAVSSPSITRIGNLDLHRQLPVQGGMYAALLADDGTENYRLNPLDWSQKLNGGASKLDGTDGQVMVYLPAFWYKSEVDGTKRRWKISEFELPGFSYSAAQYLSAYKAALLRTGNKLSSVKNTTADYRGGGNQSAWDALAQTQLGMPATAISRTNFRTYARNRGTGWEAYNYQAWWKMFLLFTIEYATLNSQAAVNTALDGSGFRQGGLGNGVTDVSSTQWNTFNSYYPFIPNGASDSLGSGSGEVTYTKVDFGGSGVNVNFRVNRYRGIEMPFGHIYDWCEGVNIRAGADSDADPTYKAYVSDVPANWNDANYTNYTLIGELPRQDGYIKEMISGHFLPLVAGGSGTGSTSFWCDYFYPSKPASGSTLQGLLLSGSAYNGAIAGLGSAHTNLAPSDTAAHLGSRLCFMPSA